MVKLNSSNNNGSIPTDTVGVQSKQSTSEVKLYEVSVVADIQLNLEGYVKVYAVDPDEAADKVQTKIDNETLDNALDMEDVDSGNIISYGDLKGCQDLNIEIDDGRIAVVEENVDPIDVFEEEVAELQSNISWNAEALVKHKVFLQSLLNEKDNNQAVAA